MTTEEMLLALKDIQAPLPPFWWQLGPAWWLFIYIILSAFGVVLLLKRHHQNRHLIASAQRELELIIDRHGKQADNRALLLALADWLKRVAILAFPHDQLEALNGDDWLSFLDRCQGDQCFSRGPGEVFGDMVYREHADFDANQIILLCRSWMAYVSPVLRQRGQS